MNHEGPAKAGPSALKRERIAAVLSIVILGLDPRIHPRGTASLCGVDPRVKPEDDGGEVGGMRKEGAKAKAKARER